MRKVLVINANPKSTSFCQSISDQYVAMASNSHEVQQLNLADMQFQIDLTMGYSEKVALEPDLVEFQDKIQWAEHIVIISPVWWGTIPAKFKGAIDRTFLPEFAFKYVEGKAFPQKLLTGRTSELIFTLDNPPFWYKYVKGNAIYKQLKTSILDFSGIKNTKATYFGPVINSTKEQRDNWLEKVAKRAKSI
ncbi:NAD(P)H-dependent oxidoreductase [Vibrio sp. LaRot3]|uniref:NAD(P)H-dependent oxidoreductase n=1 Tax=Vibrio sp. LaRot3 TaxID=2998829 RepID=UPI0022CE085A|nr:NAD(P)H-dependent oxidoreductase [Vibrio sp. LaRot3]MDA0148991.1 NAD(P)H-dependent oxidoreductase [Vibrio sp. LaRot3]